MKRSLWMIVVLMISLTACTASTSPAAVPTGTPVAAAIPPSIAATDTPIATAIPPTVAPTATPVATATIAPPVATPTQPAIPAPSARSEISLAYDSKTNQVLLFGGLKVDPCWDDCPPMLGDTWLYDVAANAWTEVKPPTAPEPRDNTALAYDAESDRIILFGGFISAKNYAPRETWAFDMNSRTWTQMKSLGPSYHFGHSMVYDSKADRMILFGGDNIEDNVTTNDTWAYDYNRDTWTEKKPAVKPPSRNFLSMVYDSKADRVIMWGGWGTTNDDNDSRVWIFDYNTDTWEARMPTGGPSSRAFHNMSYDPKADRIFLYGGYTGGMSDSWNFKTNNNSETWVYDYNLDTWTQLKPAANPGRLTSFGQVYLPTLDRILLFGGRFGLGMFNHKAWLYDYDGNAWTEAAPKP